MCSVINTKQHLCYIKKIDPTFPVLILFEIILSIVSVQEIDILFYKETIFTYTTVDIKQ